MDRYRKRRFCKNLDALLTSRSLTRKEAASEAGVPYQWLRRAVTEGISRPDKRSQGHLDALARYLNLTGADRLWDRDMYVPRSPSSIKHEADGLAELMREFVLVVGTGDELLGEVRNQLRTVLREHRDRQRKVEEERKAEREFEELRANVETSAVSASPPDAGSWEELRQRSVREQLKWVEEQRERAKTLRETIERTKIVKQAIDLFRSQYVDVWRSFGIPRVDEVHIDDAELVALAQRDRLGSVRDLAPHVADRWLAEYGRLLGMPQDKAEDSIRSAITGAFGIAWQRKPAGDRSLDESSPMLDRVGKGATGAARTLGSPTGAGHSGNEARSGWDTPPPPPHTSSIKAVARIVEEMRDYVMRVGPEDLTLWSIIVQIRATQTPPVEAVRTTEPATGSPLAVARLDPETILARRLARRRAGEARDAEKLKWAVDSQASSKLDDRTATQDSPPLAGRTGRNSYQTDRRIPEEASAPESQTQDCGPLAQRHVTGDNHPEMKFARQLLSYFDLLFLKPLREARLPRVEEVAFGMEDLFELMRRLEQNPTIQPTYVNVSKAWLDRYALLLGINGESAWPYVHAYINLFYGTFDWLPPKHVPDESVAKMEDIEDRRLRLAEQSPHAVIEQFQDAHRMELDQSNRRLATQMAARILGSLTPDQLDHLHRGYESAELSRRWVEDELLDRIRGCKNELGRTDPPQPPGDAARAVLAEIMEDYRRGNMATGDAQQNRPMGG